MAKTAFIDMTEKALSVYAGGNGRPAIVRVASVPVGDSFAFTLSEFPSDAESVLSLPLSALDLRVVELPFQEAAKIRELLPYELDGIVLGGSADIVFDFSLLGRTDDGKTRVLVAYLRKGMLRDILGRLKASGADPRVVTSVELARLIEGPLSSGAGLADALMSPPAISEEDRISAGLREARKPTFNFRQGELAYTADTQRTKKSLRITFVLFLLLLAIISADAGLTAISARSEAGSIRAGMRKTYQSLFPDEKKVSDELYQLKAHIKELGDKEALFVGVSPLQVLAEISRNRREGVTFTEISLDRDAIVMKGECRSVDEAQRLKNGLEAGLQGVTLSETRPSAQGKTLFTIIAKGKKT